MMIKLTEIGDDITISLAEWKDMLKIHSRIKDKLFILILVGNVLMLLTETTKHRELSALDRFILNTKLDCCFVTFLILRRGVY